MAKQDVLLERINNLLQTVEKQHKENQLGHNNIITRLDYTNGKVRSLQIWKATLAGAIIVISLMSGYAISDYLENKKTISENKENNAVLLEKVENVEDLLKKHSD